MSRKRDMVEALRNAMQRILRPRDTELRKEYEQFKRDVSLLIGENTTMGFDAAIHEGHNSVLIVMARLPRGDVIRHVSLNMRRPREIIAMLGHLKRTFGTKNAEIYFDGPRGFSHMMRNELEDE